LIKRAATFSARRVTVPTALPKRPPRKEFRSAPGDTVSISIDVPFEIQTNTNDHKIDASIGSKNAWNEILRSAAFKRAARE
jgi:hypothetical protein